MMQWFKGVGLTNKITIIGAFVTIVATVFTLLPLSNDKKVNQNSHGNSSPNFNNINGNVNISMDSGNNNKGNIQRAEIIRITKDFSYDLEKIKNLLPKNIYLSRCIKKGKNITKDGSKKVEIVGGCILEVEQESNDPIKIFEKNIASLYLFLDAGHFDKINKNFSKITFLINEMQNNQYTNENIKINDCPDKYEFIESSKISKEDLRKIVEEYVGCVIGVESYEGFDKRTENIEDQISPLQSPLVENIKMMYIAHPNENSKESISGYFHKENNRHYKNLLEEIDILKKQLVLIIKNNG